MNSEKVLKQIEQIAEDTKAIDIVVYDMREKDAEIDFHLICSGTSTTHVKGIVTQIEIKLKKQNIYPFNIEGKEENSWILIDYYNLIVHVFLEDERERFKIEEIFKKKTLISTVDKEL